MERARLILIKGSWLEGVFLILFWKNFFCGRKKMFYLLSEAIFNEIKKSMG